MPKLPRAVTTASLWVDDDVVAPELQFPLGFAYTRSSVHFRTAFIWPTVLRATRFVVQPIDEPNVSGFFRPSDNVIVIAAHLVRTEPANTLAAVLVHELVHAGENSRFPDTRAGAALSFREEIRAYTYEAIFFLTVRQYGSRSVLGAHLNRLVKLYQANDIARYVLLNAHYHKAYFGMEITP